MVVDAVPPFFEWLFRSTDDRMAASLSFLIIVFVCALAGLIVGYLIAVVKHGPIEAFYVVAKMVGGAATDWLQISPRRVMAIAWLAGREAIRRRVLIVAFAIFCDDLAFWGLVPQQ